jgi:4-alpha-glucanotransferase
MVVMNMTSTLHRLTRLYGVQTAYRDGLKQEREAPVEAILLALQALGAPMLRLDDIDDAYRQHRQARWQRIVEPVTVIWENQPVRLQVRVPCQLAETPSSYRIVLESGEAIEGELNDDPRFTSVSREVDSIRYLTRRLLGPAPIPFGYHRLYLHIGALEVETHLICAPIHAYRADERGAKRWGLFCPLYALHSERSWGVGDFSDLELLSEYTAEAGGHAVATLPMLASFLDEPFNPSPYAPVSRLFWNELFLDVERIPELQQSSEAKSIMSASFATEMQRLSALALVDYRRLMAVKRKVLEALTRSLLSQASERRDNFERYMATHPIAQDYAAFRAKTERERQSWLNWPAQSREGVLRPEDFDADVKRYHLYVQWQCKEQTAALCDHARARGTALYLDFPLGVNRDGYDVWRLQEQFALHMSGGAPPDGLFVKGQNWGFPPLHPELIRQQGYRYSIDCLRHHMSAAGMLRIDHVMGLHRVYWVPEGFDATDGVYVHYHAPEFYAILLLESHRLQVEIIGENLGTVPDYVNQAMTCHDIRGMHVGQFGVNVEPAMALDETPAPVVACLNTHDTATFMGFWQAKDIDDRVALGLLEESAAENERRYRAAQREALNAFLRARDLLSDDASAGAVLKGWLSYLAGQANEFLQINLEDLWLEPAPQNVPGTWSERPNWQRRARLSLEELRHTRNHHDFLKTISDIRKRMS